MVMVSALPPPPLTSCTSSLDLKGPRFVRLQSNSALLHLYFCFITNFVKVILEDRTLIPLHNPRLFSLQFFCSLFLISLNCGLMNCSFWFSFLCFINEICLFCLCSELHDARDNFAAN